MSPEDDPTQDEPSPTGYLEILERARIKQKMIASALNKADLSDRSKEILRSDLRKFIDMIHNEILLERFIKFFPENLRAEVRAYVELLKSAHKLQISTDVLKRGESGESNA